MENLEENIWAVLSEDLREFDKELFEKSPLLAHYTSIGVLESILKNKQVWLTNPLLSNDYKEVEYAMEDIPSILTFTEAFRNLDYPLRGVIMDKIIKPIFDFHLDFKLRQLHENFVMSFCEHSPADKDGILSMWRGYGQDGNGAALVFDTSKLSFENPHPAIVVGRVQYVSDSEKYRFVDGVMKKFIEYIIGNNISSDLYETAAKMLFRRLRLAAYFSKHVGFREEREWRIVYFGDQDFDGHFKSMRSYFINESGIAPVLKLNIEDNAALGPGRASEFIDRIILGPGHTNELRQQAVLTMLVELGYPSVRVDFSSIPYRSRS